MQNSTKQLFCNGNYGRLSNSNYRLIDGANLFDNCWNIRYKHKPLFMDDYRIKLQTVFERITHGSNIYIEKNNVKGFLHFCWNTIATEFPDVKQLLEKSNTPGFKSSEEQQRLYDFATVKQALDKILIIMFDTVVLNTPAAFESMKEKIFQLINKDK